MYICGHGYGSGVCVCVTAAVVCCCVMAISVMRSLAVCKWEFSALYQNLRQQVVYLKYTFTLLHAIYLNYVLIIHHLYVHVAMLSPLLKTKTINSADELKRWTHYVVYSLQFTHTAPLLRRKHFKSNKNAFASNLAIRPHTNFWLVFDVHSRFFLVRCSDHTFTGRISQLLTIINSENWL